LGAAADAGEAINRVRITAKDAFPSPEHSRCSPSVSPDSFPDCRAFKLVSLFANIVATAGALAPFAAIAALCGCATPPSLPDPLAAGWNGVSVCEKLHEDSEQRVLRCSFPPSVGHERHFHHRHFGYAIAGGRMQITDASGTRKVDLATGSSFTSPGVAWHEVVNIGDTTVVYLIVEPK
jgi:beta-alanine degradation protein BauB